MDNKDIKDYLHLYLGCNVKTLNGIETLVLVGTLGSEQQQVRTLGQYQSFTNGFNIHEVKPILRPLSDMTEEEAIECYELCWPGHQILPDLKGKHILELFTDESDPDYSYGNVLGNANTFRWALSKGFDLFNLIEAGLAIDKTKLKDNGQ